MLLVGVLTLTIHELIFLDRGGGGGGGGDLLRLLE